jgi:hypothetical protein
MSRACSETSAKSCGRARIPGSDTYGRIGQEKGAQEPDAASLQDVQRRIGEHAIEAVEQPADEIRASIGGTARVHESRVLLDHVGVVRQEGLVCGQSVRLAGQVTLTQGQRSTQNDVDGLARGRHDQLLAGAFFVWVPEDVSVLVDVPQARRLGVTDEAIIQRLVDE